MMFSRWVLFLSLLVFAESSTLCQTATVRKDAICKNSGEYCVNRETSSGVCHVQETTESPLGVNMLGPYASRKDGVKGMCGAYDPGSTDPKKCSDVAPSGACDNK